MRNMRSPPALSLNDGLAKYGEQSTNKEAMMSTESVNYSLRNYFHN